MKYLLIDTNSWIDLYVQTSESANLEQLLKWERDGKVKFLMPETLSKEFTRQKKIQLDLLDKKINSLSNTADRETLSRLKEDFRFVEKKISAIEAVLLKSMKIPNTKKTHHLVGIKYEQGQPPFHNNSNSHNDAYIYFSTVEYLQKFKINTFVFITRNSNDFGAPGSANLHLHPGLLIPGIEVQYVAPVAFAVNVLRKELGNDAVQADADYSEIFYLFPEDPNEAVADQLYRALEKYNDQLPFIPTHLLARIFPFKTVNFRHPEAYHSAFQLNTNNARLMKFFTSFRIGKMNSIHFNTGSFKGGKKLKGKTQSIIKNLNANLIYDMQGIGDGSKADIRLKHSEACNCIRCAYNRFDIYEAFTLLDTLPKQTHADTLKQAYMHYQFQLYDQSLKLFFIVYQDSVENGRHLLALICLANLKRLIRVIQYNSYSPDKGMTEIISEVNKLSLKKAFLAIPSADPFVSEAAEWIAEDHFYNRAFAEITDTIEKIRDHYNIQLRGGHSSNSNFDILVSQFAELDSFVELNGLVYNNFLEFENAAGKLVEGLFMYFSFNPGQRIEFINDYLLGRIIMFAKTETIIKCYNRFLKGGLIYGEGPGKKSKLPYWAETFFTGLTKLYRTQGYVKSAELLFFDKNRRILNNILVLLALSKDVYDYKRIFESLLPVLEIEQLIMHEAIGYVADFIREKGRYISDELLNRFLQFAIEHKQSHDQKVFTALSLLATKKQKKILVTDPHLYNSVKDSFLVPCKLCGHMHTDILMPLMPLLAPAFQTEMQQQLLRSFDSQFNADLYYTLAIGGVIDYRPHLSQFEELCERPLKNADRRTHPFMQGEANLYRLNELLNIYFKNSLDTSGDFFTKFKGYSDYYDWILDLDGFDYKKFNPLWILEYQTIYYLERIFASTKVKKHLLTYLKKQKHAVLNELYIKYCS